MVFLVFGGLGFLLLALRNFVHLGLAGGLGLGFLNTGLGLGLSHPVHAYRHPHVSDGCVCTDNIINPLSPGDANLRPELGRV